MTCVWENTRYVAGLMNRTHGMRAVLTEVTCAVRAALTEDDNA